MTPHGTFWPQKGDQSPCRLLPSGNTAAGTAAVGGSVTAWAEEQDHVRLTYSRTMPEHLESIAAPAVLWQQLSELGDRYHITAWAGYNELPPAHPPYQALATVYHLRRWYQPAGGGLRRRPKGHEQWENDLLALLNSCIDV